MDFKYLAMKSAFFQSCDWTTSTTTDTILAAGTLNLSAYSTEVTRTAGPNSMTYADVIPVTWIARFFAYWRGSIVFTFKIVKTGYHSGRLMFYAVPDDNDNAVPSPTLVGTQYLNRTIMDIREGNEYKIVVPYSSLRPWLRCHRYPAASGERFGRWYLTVINELTCPDTVS